MAVVRGGIPPQILQQIREATDITEMVSRYVTLTKSGQNYKGLCPFHAEKTPSFSVSPSRQMFYCFGCGVGGDVISFVMQKEGIGFIDAVKELAQHAGVTLSTERGVLRPDRKYVIQKRLEELHTIALTWFTKNLLDPSLGQSARTYLLERQIRSETFQEFSLGYAPSSWDGLTRHLMKAGASLEELVQSGLVIAKEAKSKGTLSVAGCYDRFRSRIMFPICNLRGQVSAFGGRVLDEGTPKYLNSPETPIFNKGRSLFGLERAREAASQVNTILLVEGYFDVIALHQAGIHNVVAPLGTALSKEHVETLRRFAQTVMLVFDGDSAGINAALRTLDLFVNSGVSVKVVVMPADEDPDSFVRTQGPEQIIHLQEQAGTLLNFAVDQCLRGMTGETVEDRARSVDRILRILQKTHNMIEKEEYTRQVAERLGIRQQLLVDRYPRLMSQAPSLSKDGGTMRTSPSAMRGPKQKTTREEQDLVALLLQGQLAACHLQMLHLDDFTHPPFRRIIEMGLSHLGEDGKIMLDHLYADAADEECGPLVAELTMKPMPLDDMSAYIQGCLKTLAQKRLKSELEVLIQKLRVAEREKRVEDIDRLNAEIEQLREQKANSIPIMPVQS